jgi:PAS domain S-box-containing protein
MALPIRRKLTAMMLSTSAAILLVTCTAFIAYDFVTFRRSNQEQIGTLGRIIAINSTAALAFRNAEDAGDVLAALKGEPHVTGAALYDHDGRLFARYPGDAPATAFPPGPGAEGYAFEDGQLSGFQPVSEHAGLHLGDLFVRSDMSAMNERLRQYGLIAAAVFAFSLLLAYVLARTLQERISKPLLSLTETARAISERADYSVRAPMEGEAEFQVLTGAFNQMLAQIGAQNAVVRESEERLRAVMNSALSAVVLMDANGTIVDWNLCAERIFGWSRAEAVGKQLADTIIPPRYRDAHREGLRRFAGGAGSKIIDQTLEMWALRRDGSLFPVEISISVLKMDANTMFCGFVTDITERAEARGRVQTQIARLDLLQRTTRAIGERQDLHSIFQVIVRNLEDNLPIDFGCVCLYDGTAQQKLVIATIGAKSSLFAHALGLAQRSEISIEENGLAACINGRLMHEPDLAGAPFPFSQGLARVGLHSLVAAPLLVESKVFGVLIAARTRQHSFSSADCEFLRQLSEHVALAAHQVQLYTALQGAYDELRQSQQTLLQQERLRALGQMASGIAHDINNAISPVALYTESLLEREPNLSQRTRDYLTTIRRSIDDVAQTVARMREFYRQRDPQSNLAPLDLNPAVEQVLHLTQARWRDVPQERGIVIAARTELAADLPRILGTESDIRDALTNLVFNAVDAMPGGGALTIRTRAIDAGGRRTVELAVIDSGAGMDEETRRRCLEPFFTTKGERGTGMGLAMVYGMVKRHAAQIEIESAPGRGTTMRVLFEPAPSDAVAASVKPAAVRPPRNLRLLVVDDDPLLTRSLAHTLEADGHTVTVADGGKAGIDAFQSACDAGESFDLVITDLGMPYVDGRAVASAVKRISPETPVLMLTGWGQRLNMEQAVPPCVDRVLSKPPGLHELRAALVDMTQTHGAAERV